jgi:hypothetical protein
VPELAGHSPAQLQLPSPTADKQAPAKSPSKSFFGSFMKRKPSTTNLSSPGVRPSGNSYSTEAKSMFTTKAMSRQATKGDGQLDIPVPNNPWEWETWYDDKADLWQVGAGMGLQVPCAHICLCAART